MAVAEVVAALDLVARRDDPRLHQDGLADTLDGLAGGRIPTDRLTIMRDPRIGAIGATGLFVSLILRYSALVSLPEPLKFQRYSVRRQSAAGPWLSAPTGLHMREQRRLARSIFSTPLSVARPARRWLLCSDGVVLWLRCCPDWSC